MYDLCIYRPINLTSLVSRVMETVVRNRTLNYLIESNLLNSRQQAFPQFRSAPPSLSLYNFVANTAVRGMTFAVIHPDVPKALNHFHHSHLTRRVWFSSTTSPLPSLLSRRRNSPGRFHFKYFFQTTDLFASRTH